MPPNDFLSWHDEVASQDEFLSFSHDGKFPSQDDFLSYLHDRVPNQDNFVMSFLHEEDEEAVEEEEERELLGHSMDRPLLSPPAHGHPDDEDGLPRPDFVLMQQWAYFIDRDNATTASCDARGPYLEGGFKVTFCVAPPPLVSYFCVHATAYTHTDFVMDPLILASETDGGLVLLCFVIGKSKSDRSRSCCHHYFVYDSGARGTPPSLKHLPHPNDFFGSSNEFVGASLAIVRHCNQRSDSTLHPRAACQREHDPSEGHYVIVARDQDFGYESPSYLCFYHSVTDCWGFKTVEVPTAYQGHSTSKTLTIGEEVAWFDLSRNVVFCDVLAETPKVRVVGLPPPINKVTEPRTVRDIAVVDGCINCVEVHHEIKDGVIKGWMAARWSMEIASHSEEWHLDHKVHSSNILVSSSKFDEGNTAEPNLRRLHLGLPNLSLQDKNIAYFLAKIHFLDQQAWVIAVDFKNNKIREVVEYDAIRTVGLFFGYSASRISKYLHRSREAAA